MLKLMQLLTAAATSVPTTPTMPPETVPVTVPPGATVPADLAATIIEQADRVVALDHMIIAFLLFFAVCILFWGGYRLFRIFF